MTNDWPNKKGKYVCVLSLLIFYRHDVWNEKNQNKIKSNYTYVWTGSGDWWFFGLKLVNFEINLPFLYIFSLLQFRYNLKIVKLFTIFL